VINLKLTFGFFISKPFEVLVKKIEPELIPFCNIIYLTAASQEDVVSAYKAYENQVDGFMFSGMLTYTFLLEKIASPNKPCFCIDETQIDIKEIFLNLLVKDRNFDFSRIFVDSATKENQYLGIKEILVNGPFPIFNEIPYNDAVSFELEMKARHRELHDKKMVDLSITRLGHCLEELQTYGIPCIYAYPPESYMINFFMKAINEINLSKTEKQILGTIIIFPESDSKLVTDYTRDVHMLKFCELITTYAQVAGYDFTLQEKDSYIEVLTHYRDIAKITDDFQTCDLKIYLEEKSGEHVNIGFGTGHNIYKARLNAHEAVKISKQKADGPYYLSYEDKIIGPLSGNIQSYVTKPSPQFLAWSKKLHVNHVNLQKIIAFTKVSGTTKVTSDSLAEYLSISLRSANRLLTKIYDNNGAVTYLENIDGRPGRPKKYFDLTFIKNIND